MLVRSWELTLCFFWIWIWGGTTCRLGAYNRRSVVCFNSNHLFSLSLFFSLHCALHVLLHCSGIFSLRFELLRIQLHFTLGHLFTLRASFEPCHFRLKLRSRYPSFQSFSCFFLLHLRLLSLIVVFYWLFVYVLWF